MRFSTASIWVTNDDILPESKPSEITVKGFVLAGLEILTSCEQSIETWPPLTLPAEQSDTVGVAPAISLTWGGAPVVYRGWSRGHSCMPAMPVPIAVNPSDKRAIVLGFNGPPPPSEP